MDDWYVLHTKPHKERQVAEHLRHRQLEAYLPLVRVRPANPRAARLRPYFPCYLFVKLPEASPSAVQWTPGLRQLVEFGGQAAAVPEGFVAELKGRLAELGQAGGLALAGLKAGDRVKVQSGPFAGYEALFDARLGGNERVRVLLEVIRQHQGRPQPVRRIPATLNADQIAKVRPGPG